MAIPSHYQDVIDTVDANVVLNFESGYSDYGTFEWSYSCVPGSPTSTYYIKGGTEKACEHGATALLEAMGFRFYTPSDEFWVVPNSIPTNLSAARQQFFMPDSRVWLAFGHGSANATAVALQAANVKWQYLNGVYYDLYLAGHRWNSICINASIESSGFWTSHPGVRYDMNKVASPDSSATPPAGTTDSGTNPVLSAFTVAACGSEARLFTVTTTTNNGTLYVVASGSATAPTSQQIRDGQNHLGATVPSRTITITNSGTWTSYSISGLTPSSTYYLHAIHRDSSNRDSNIVTSSSSTTLARAYTFDLQEAIDNNYYDDLVELCAANLLTEGFNEANTTAFDPSDSDPQDSDLVFPFTKAVADAVRAGTSAIGPYGALSGNPTAQIGIYAYAGHRMPPETSVSPGVYTQVALGFNRTGLSYRELIKQHAEKSDGIKLREYWDTPIWSRGAPMVNGRTRRTYFDSYADYIAAADEAGKELIGANCEFSANWLVNIVMARWGILYFREGSTYTYEQVLAEIVEDVFDGDPAVTELYMLWSDPYKRWHRFSCLDSMEIVNDMVDGWYKTYFKKLLVVLYEKIYLPQQTPLAQQDETDPFPAAFSSMMSHAWSLQQYDITHAWGWVRVEANGAVVTNYNSLRYTNNPEWYTDPVEPNDTDYTNAYNTLVADNNRDSTTLDSSDLVLVNGITPKTAASGDAERFYVLDTSTYVFVGPGTVTLTENDTTIVGGGENGEDIVIEGGTRTETFGAGWHLVQTDTTATATWTGGRLFLVAFPYTALRPEETSPTSKWLYIQSDVEDAVDIEPGSRTRIRDQNGNTDIYQSYDANYDGPYTSLGPGQVMVEVVNTQGINAVNVNMYVSPYSTIQLMPRALAEAEFPARTKITRG